MVLDKKVLVLDTIWESGLKRLRSLCQVDVKLGIGKKEIANIIGKYNVVILKSGSVVDKEVLSRASNLELIIRAGSSLDNVDMEECKSKNIKVLSTHESVTIAVAEFTVALILSVCRRLPVLFQVTKNKDFRRDLYLGKELRSLSVGLIGLGRIGMRTANLLRSFGGTLIGYDEDPLKLSEFRMIGGKTATNLSAVLQESDIVTLHLPLNSKTEYIIDRHALSQLKKGAIIVNTARGKLINSRDLLRFLDDGTVSYAVLDVLDPDPSFHIKPEDSTYKNPLLDHPNVYVSPHSAASTEQSLQNVAEEILKSILDFYGVG